MQLMSARRQATWAAKHAKLQTAATPPKLPKLNGLHIFVHEDAKAILYHRNDKWCLVKNELGLIVVADVALADICVVLNPSEAGDRLSMVAAMRGGYLVTPGHMLESGGVCLKLHPALARPRHIFISRRCSDKHRAIIELVMQVYNSVPVAARRWTWYRETEGANDVKKTFLARAAKRKTSGHLSEIVTVLVPEEMATATYAHAPNRQLLKTFLNGIRQVDVGFTHMGYRGR